ncbi:uncharacterized protein VP01_8761g1 [Puccinia sorghi]|uniref:Uncharacterized protein n=1 Tax=Puccinia sorghi TaxID=27349 RepID=A0A0L6U8J2_9BASI|nr:uncharacterized protein VP01_8761g1 [Puccinia sorghi]
MIGFTHTLQKVTSWPRTSALAHMDHASFIFVCDKIKGNEVLFNNSHHQKAPVAWKLLVALTHYGLNSNGGSQHILAQFFHISGLLCVSFAHVMISPPLKLL